MSKVDHTPQVISMLRIRPTHTSLIRPTPQIQSNDQTFSLKNPWSRYVKVVLAITNIIQNITTVGKM